MVSLTQIATIIENALNALNGSDKGYEFKIWANAGEHKKPYRQGNKVFYYIEGDLLPTTTAVDPNVLPMGVYGLSLTVLVRTDIPRTDITETDADLAKIKEGQIDFVNRIAQLLTQYFTAAQVLVLTDENGESFGYTMVGAVAVPENIDIYTSAGEAVPLRVAISLNYVLGGINALDVKLYLNGMRVPYMMFNPSRSAALETEVQSNNTEQKSFATSSVYGIQFTAPSSVANPATAAIYDFIADEAEINTAEFIEVEWGTQRTDAYLMFISSANVTAQGAEFAGLNVSLTKIYGNEEFFKYPSEFGTGVFRASVSSASSLTFTVSADFHKGFPLKNVPDTFPLYVYIAGKTFRFEGTQISAVDATVSYHASGTVTVSLGPENYAYDEANDDYAVYLITSEAVTVTGVSTGFTYAALNAQ